MVWNIPKPRTEEEVIAIFELSCGTIVGNGPLKDMRESGDMFFMRLSFADEHAQTLACALTGTRWEGSKLLIRKCMQQSTTTKQIQTPAIIIQSSKPNFRTRELSTNQKKNFYFQKKKIIITKQKKFWLEFFLFFLWLVSPSAMKESEKAREKKKKKRSTDVLKEGKVQPREWGSVTCP
ncbi:hypothetical protein RFI_18547 [Reticulomyxa filosa]|uniref:RRM domain-containing protein n=1 Tax=Reticulomyxa filosa TaxID=46433 RepID=X6MYJ6_RETFI|nr:hypothetical protein RFI_18547 [Reticulomyxa filosa]|eukprot:ETO18708.1 hypothetical protein RFI_18547 [Reticulomyxa filosa]